MRLLAIQLIAGALLLSGLTLGCGDSEESDSGPAPAARRRSPINGPALIAQAKRLETRACACKTAECGTRLLTDLSDYGHQHVGVRLDAAADAQVRAHVEAAATCAVKAQQ